MHFNSNGMTSLHEVCAKINLWTLQRIRLGNLEITNSAILQKVIISILATNHQRGNKFTDPVTSISQHFLIPEKKLSYFHISYVTCLAW